MKLNKRFGNYFYLDFSIQIILMLIFILVPIFFTSLIHNSFTTEKIVIFRTGVLLALALSVVRFTYFKTEIKFPWYFWLVPMFGLIGIFSTVFGINPLVSLWGIHLRMDGLVNMLFLVCFFVLIYLNLDSKTKINQIILAIVLGSIVPTVYAIMQKFGLDPIDWKEVVASERVFGTLGNPAYLGAYLLFTFPLTFYLTAKEKFIKKIFFAMLALAQIVVIVFTWTRAAYLGVGIELVILLLSYFWIINKKRLFWLSCGLVAVLIVFVAAINVNQDAAKLFGNNRYIQRLSNLTQINEGTGKDRLEMWKIAAKAVEERPLLGSGLSQYVQYFNKYYPNYMDSRPEKDRYSNYSHNLWLDTAVAHGLAGVGTLIFIYLVYIYAGVKKVFSTENKNERLLYIALSVSLVGYLAQATFNIETVITWVFSFGLLGILLAAIGEKEENDYLETKNMSVLWQIGANLLAMGAVVAIYFLAINLWSADKRYFYIDNTNLGMTEKIALAEEAKKLTPYFEYSYIRVGDLYSSTIDFNDPQKAAQLLEKTLAEITKATEINPNNYKNYLSLATIYASWVAIDDSKIADSEKYFAMAEKLSPDRLGLHWTWGNANIDWNRLDEAKKQFELAESQNKNVGETYYYLAKVDFLEGKKEDGESDLTTATNKGYSFDQAKFYQDLSLIAYKQKRIEIAKELAEKANALGVTELTAMIEIQANLEMDNSDTAKSLLEKYDKVLPGLKKKFGG